MSLKAGIDLDGVIIDNWPYWRQFYLENEKVHNHPIKGKDIPKLYAPSWDFLRDICRKCWNPCLHDDRFILGYSPKDGVQPILEWLNSCGIELTLITNRPRDVEEKTLEWLRKNDLYDLFSAVYVVQDKVAVACELGLDYMLDDAPHNIEAFQACATKMLIWDMPYNQHCKGQRVSSWYKVATILLAEKEKKKREENPTAQRSSLTRV